ncbi:hypothetical protein Cfor_03262 [Coptotermes formosanus]|jgi:hypothetical protein|uniref:CCHC-type domain-containing protein n=1 Tax=Coptotermes formosanus TaxID=36987 RepID=A0A6L2PMI3_COPFO|nr:hypothetical protein Cfor_03262 [Coptotermes formosanus]
MKTKIIRDDRSELTVTDLIHTWYLVKGILEENYAIWHSDYCACKMFSDRQGKGESVASWQHRIDEKRTDLGAAARCVCKPKEVQGGGGLTGKVHFIQGLYNEQVQTIVESRGESILLPQATEISLERKAPSCWCRNKPEATGPLVRCHKCKKLGHVANTCKSNDKFPHNHAREVIKCSREVRSCTEEGTSSTPEVDHLTKNCRQGSICRKVAKSTTQRVTVQPKIKVGQTRETKIGSL